MKLPRLSVLLSTLLVFAAISTNPASAAVTTLTAVLSGSNERPDPGDTDGTGTAIVRLDPESGTIDYVLLTDDVLTPTAAHIHRGTAEVAGGVVVDFNPSFAYNPTFSFGSATGSVHADAALIQEIVANPAGFYVNVHSPLFPSGAVRGQLGSQSEFTSAVFPIAGAAAGANGTMFRTDLTLLNPGQSEALVLIEYYAAGAAGNSAPTATAMTSLLPSVQETFGNIVQTTFNISGTGAIRIISSSPLIATSRIYNDLRPAGGGTFGQFVPSYAAGVNAGALPMLANQHPQSGSGFRSNVGYFNASGRPVFVTFSAHRFNGTILESNTMTVAPWSQQQFTLNQLFPSLEPHDSMYVSFTTAGGPLYVYASVIDNITGDAVFVPAQ